MSRYFSRKVDDNQPAIVKALRTAGYTVFNLARAGNGIPDILVLSKKGIFVLFEIKMPGEGLNSNEIEFFHETIGAPRHVVFSGEEAKDIMRKYYD